MRANTTRREDLKHIAAYVISGDPITFGHMDIIRRASDVFDELIVGIGINPTKNYLFSLEERVALTKRAVASLKNVTVKGFTGFATDFAYENQTQIFVKGVRNATDFDYEAMLSQIGDTQSQGFETFLLFSDRNLSHVSSSAVKAIVTEYGFVHDFVPLNVKTALEEKVLQRHIVGVTGVIGAGKTTFCQRLAKQSTDTLPIHHINIDLLGRKILEDPRHTTTQRQLIDTFGDQIFIANRINRETLMEIVFKDRKKLDTFNQIMRKPLMIELRRSIYQKSGLILLESALLAEEGLLDLCNNRVVYINTQPDALDQRLSARGYSDDQISHRRTAQFDARKKQKNIETQIETSGFGKMWVVRGDELLDVKRFINEGFKTFLRTNRRSYERS